MLIGTYYRLNGGADSLWLANTKETSATFTGRGSNKYEFWSVAVDNAGNVEDVPLTADASTTVITDANEAGI